MSLGATATKEDGELIAKLFGAVGKVWQADEKLFDAVTGLRYVVCVIIKPLLLLITCCSGDPLL